MIFLTSFKTELKTRLIEAYMDLRWLLKCARYMSPHLKIMAPPHCPHCKILEPPQELTTTLQRIRNYKLCLKKAHIFER